MRRFSLRLSGIDNRGFHTVGWIACRWLVGDKIAKIDFFHKHPGSVVKQVHFVPADGKETEIRQFQDFIDEFGHDNALHVAIGAAMEEDRRRMETVYS